MHVELRGGNDGLNTVAPYSDARYRSARPGLALDVDQMCRIDARRAFHPNLEPLFPMWTRGWMAVVESVGSPRPDRSHFFTRRVWETADPEARTREGWLARALDLGGRPAPVCVGEEPLGLCTSRRRSPCVLRDLRDLQLARDLVAHVDPAELAQLLGGTAGPPNEARLAFTSALEYAACVPDCAASSTGDPTTLRERLDTVAALIEMDLDGSAYATVLDGFDTHKIQAYTHGVLLREFAEAVAAFFSRLERSSAHEGVLLVAWSEFGRRLAQNASRGTDHGLAGPVFAFGPDVSGGLYGEPPDLGDLDEGDIRARVDLRRVAVEMAGYLDLDAGRVLQEEFEPVGFLA